MPFVNGNFEGEITGWENVRWGSGTHTETCGISTVAAITGTNGFRCQASADNGGGSTSYALALQQNISTDFTYINFDYNPAAITSQSGMTISLKVEVSDTDGFPVVVYNNVLDGESPGVVHVHLTKAGDMSAVNFGETMWFRVGVHIAGS